MTRRSWLLVLCLKLPKGDRDRALAFPALCTGIFADLAAARSPLDRVH